jgi:hypothetical protein
VGIRDLVNRLLGRGAAEQEPRPEEVQPQTPDEAAQEQRWDSIQEREKKVRDDEPDKDRYQDV